MLANFRRSSYAAAGTNKVGQPQMQTLSAAGRVTGGVLQPGLERHSMGGDYGVMQGPVRTTGGNNRVVPGINTSRSNVAERNNSVTQNRFRRLFTLEP